MALPYRPLMTSGMFPGKAPARSVPRDGTWTSRVETMVTSMKSVLVLLAVFGVAVLMLILFL